MSSGGFLYDRPRPSLCGLSRSADARARIRGERWHRTGGGRHCDDRQKVDTRERERSPERDSCISSLPPSLSSPLLSTPLVSIDAPRRFRARRNRPRNSRRGSGCVGGSSGEWVRFWTGGVCFNCRLRFSGYESAAINSSSDCRDARRNDGGWCGCFYRPQCRCCRSGCGCRCCDCRCGRRASPRARPRSDRLTTTPAESSRQVVAPPSPRVPPLVCGRSLAGALR